jgi:hypothetical protein
MYYTLILFAFVSLVFASCDLPFCVNQFCPPSVGDVGWCLCGGGGNQIGDVTYCLIQECGLDGAMYPAGNLTACCGITLT